MGVTKVNNGKEEVAQANYPQIRLFKVKRNVSDVPQADFTDPNASYGTWQLCSPESIANTGWGGFSATAYFFGRELHKTLHAPVGLIDSSWGGTIIETWISIDKLESDPEFVDSIKSLKIVLAQAQKKNAITTAKPGPNEPPGTAVPISPKGPNGRPSRLYNGMISPIIPYAIKGVIWYQGEQNTPRANMYRKLFAALIADWRTRWQEDDFPFLFAQLASYKVSPKQQCEPVQWAQLREAQLKTLELPNTAMAVTLDISGDPRAIHPKNKQEVGHRLALCALAKTYGKHIEYSGPLYKSMKVESGKICLTFTHTEGLVAKGDELKGFTIAGADQKFVPAHAVIKDGTVIVEHSEVKDPVAVRYGWSDVIGECNLFNAAGLPASPFRTDNWPGVTDSEK
jgi:sialate O-acetylesterase